ncbi:LuxR C-terminal-related transcriptional regulator [Sulfurimonas sp. HSL-1716]|uniref:response regulator transcription factor n=1 Tax=Hydrocurvibacter sulfurireducens TaxID=3131937 RepID=UPI0031F893C2
MQTILFFSYDYTMLQELEKKEDRHPFESFDNEAGLIAYIKENPDSIVVADYDSVSHEVNDWISSDKAPKNLIILEKVPTLATGRFLISHGINGYGNSRMQKVHYTQMIETVSSSQIWTYPELTAALVTLNSNMINADAKPLIQRLSDKEKEVTFYILNGFTNAAIANKMDISTRTVKAHVSSIFQKLHVNDRVSLVLLLK